MRKPLCDKGNTFKQGNITASKDKHFGTEMLMMKMVPLHHSTVADCNDDDDDDNDDNDDDDEDDEIVV